MIKINTSKIDGLVSKTASSASKMVATTAKTASSLSITGSTVIAGAGASLMAVAAAKEAEKKAAEEKKQKDTDSQNTNVKYTLNTVMSGYEEVISKLKKLSNILYEDIQIDNVGFNKNKVDTIIKTINS